MGFIGEKVRVAIIGMGVIGRKHANAIAESPNATLTAIIDPTPAGRAFAVETGVEFFESVESFLSNATPIDGVIICTPNETHVPIAKQIASAGIHLLVEKPLSPRTTDGASLLSHCVDNHVQVCVGHHRRQNPRILAAKKALEKASIGDIVGCTGMWATLKSLDYFEGSGAWRREATGGVVLINLIHEIDLLQNLIARIVRVHAEKAPSTRGFEAEEGVALTLRFENGAVGTFLALDNASSPFTFEQGTGEFTYHPYTGQNSYHILGRRGTLSLPQNELWTPKSLSDGWKSTLQTTTVEWKESDAFSQQLENFIEVIRGTALPSCSGADGLAAVAVCEAIHQSLKKGCPIEVDHYMC